MFSDPKVWVVSELFYPEDTSTGYYMTKIAEGLSKRWNVGVLTSQPTYSKRSLRSPYRETWNGITIIRCPGTTFDKNKLSRRVLNAATISCSIFTHALAMVGKNDVVIVVTNPPILPFVSLAACKAKGARCILKIDDVYPDALVVSGLIKSDNYVASAGNIAQRALLARMDRIIVLGRCMAKRIHDKLGKDNNNVEVITSWSDIDMTKPMPKENNILLASLGLSDKFIILIAGNIGRLQDVETIVNAAQNLHDKQNIHFLFVGSGAKAPWLREKIEKEGIKNITVVPQRPRSEQSIFMNACDVALVALRRGMSGLGVPSRFYNHIAAGKPIIAMIERDSEVCMVVVEEKLGWVVDPGDSASLTGCILESCRKRDLLHDMGVRARMLAETKYSYDEVIKRYIRAVEQVMTVPDGDRQK